MYAQEIALEIRRAPPANQVRDVGVSGMNAFAFSICAQVSLFNSVISQCWQRKPAHWDLSYVCKRGTLCFLKGSQTV